jgi:hypothetical protein
MNRPFSRRAMIKTLVFGAAAAGLTKRESLAADAAKMDIEDPAARAVGYVEHAEAVDAKKYPTFVKGSTCENCLQLQGNDGARYRPCAIFNGKLVAVSGWCTGWTAEM